MAINGIITKTLVSGTAYGGQMLVDFIWNRASYSRDANTSTINWSIVFRDEANKVSFVEDTISATLIIDGVQTTETIKSIKTSTFGFASNTVATGTRTIKHNTDGSKTFSVQCTFTFLNFGAVVLSSSFDLDRITQASSITCTNVNIGVAPVITINSQNPAYLHTISYGFGDQEHGYITGEFATKTSRKQITDFVWPESFYQVIPNSKSGTGTFA